MTWPGIESWSPWPLANTNHYANRPGHVCVCVFICLYVYIFTYLSIQARSNTMSLEFRIFLLLVPFSNHHWRAKSAMLFTHSWRESNWIHTLPKDISAMWNVNSYLQDLSPCCHVHFLRWYPLHHECLPCVYVMCRCVCIYVCSWIHMYVCVFVCVHISLWMCMLVDVHVYVYLSIYFSNHSPIGRMWYKVNF